MDGNVLLASFIFIAAALVLVPAAKLSGLGTVLGYLIAGVIIGPYVLGLVSDPETVLHFSEFGVVLMLFLIGLELQPRELWQLRTRLLGLGGAQVAITATLIAAAGIALGIAWQSAIVAGLALALSSTAIVLQIMAERGMTRTDTGRSGFSVLLFQDIAVIPILAIIPFLAIPGLQVVGVDTHGAEADLSHAADEPGWMITARTIGAFAAMILAGRFVLRPVMHYIARTNIREIFTALALFLVVGASLLMDWLNLSHALGAFFAGVILADSEYRHELESDIEPFKGLLLGLFFISVGMSIEFSVLFESPFVIAGLVLALVAVKFGVLFGLGTIFRINLTDRLLFAILLAQGGEFAFVLLQYGLGAGAIERGVADVLNVTVALSMAITPLLILAFDKLVSPRLNREEDDDEIPDMGDTRQKVLILGYGRFGQIIARLLHAQGFETTLIDHNPAQIELVKRFGWQVFYGDVGRPDLLEAAGAGEARLIVVTIKDHDRSMEICRMVRRRYPHTPLYVRALDRSHAFDLIDLGVEGYERETFRSALALAAKALVGLGYSEHSAQRLAKAFERHDIEVLEEGAKLRNDADAYLSFMHQSRDVLHGVMEADLNEEDRHGASDWQPADREIDKEARARSE